MRMPPAVEFPDVITLNEKDPDPPPELLFEPELLLDPELLLFEPELLLFWLGA